MKKLILISTLLIGCLTPNIPPKNAEKIYREVSICWIASDGVTRDIKIFNTSIEHASRKFEQTHGKQYFAVISVLEKNNMQYYNFPEEQ